MYIALYGDPPAAVREVVQAAGLEEHPGPEAVALAWPDAEGLAALRRLAAEGQAGLALVATDEQMLPAAVAGAAGSASATSAQRLRLEVECHLRLRRSAAEAAREVTQHQRLAAAMRDQLIAVSPDPIVCADPSGRIIVFSASAERSLGYAADDVIENLHVSDIYANPGDARRVLAEIRCSVDGVLRDLPIRLRSRAGEYIPVLLSAAEVEDEQGSLIATVGVFRDQRAEQDLRLRLDQATRQLIHSERRAAAISVAKDAAHELNQPLTSLLATLELLEMHPDLPEEARRRLERMYRHLDRMTELVRRLSQHSLTDVPDADTLP